MRAFSCPECDALVHFQNSVCLVSDTQLAYSRVQGEMVVPGPRCANHGLIGCNWLAAREGELCFSCAMTRTRPADDDADGLRELAKAEGAKRRLVFELGELGLPMEGLSFDLLSSARGPVVTGHADGLITLDLAEADAAHRVELREKMHEPYRTVLGHFRHEVSHWLQTQLIAPDSPEEATMRELFGDERADYQEAMDRHYAEGAPDDWERTYVSAYATMHPWEDWAETFAQYLHIRDAMQTARSYGLLLALPSPGFGALLGDWLPLAIALNAMNRSMGLEDLYPFVISPPVAKKLTFIDDIVSAA